ncbi:hypothetical protein PG995_006892 [Apiospora arundinis]
MKVGQAEPHRIGWIVGADIVNVDIMCCIQLTFFVLTHTYDVESYGVNGRRDRGAVTEIDEEYDTWPLVVTTSNDVRLGLFDSSI